MSSPKFKNVHTMIGPDANINGPIKLDQSIIIYGKVFGDISTRGSIRVATLIEPLVLMSPKTLPYIIIL